MFYLSNRNLIKEAMPYEMNITCIQDAEISDNDSEENIISSITPNTTIKEFIAICSQNPEYKLFKTAKLGLSIIGSAVTNGNIPLLKYIVSVGGKDLLCLRETTFSKYLPLENSLWCDCDEKISTAIEIIKLGSPVTGKSLKNVLKMLTTSNWTNCENLEEQTYNLAKLLILNGALNNRVVYLKKFNELQISEEFGNDDIKETKFTIEQQAVIDKILVELDVEIKNEKKSRYEFLLCADVYGFPKDLSQEIFSYNNWKIVK